MEAASKANPPAAEFLRGGFIGTIVVTIIFNIIITMIIIITRPKPAYGRQGLEGSWGQDTDKVSTFWVFLTSHFAPAALSSELNQPGTIHDDTNPPGIMKTRPGAIKKNMKNQPGTMKNQPGTTENLKNQP